MRIRRGRLIVCAIALAALLVVILAAAPDQCAYAKGVRKSSDSSSDRSSSDKSSSGSEERGSSRSSDNSSERSSPPPSSSRSDDRGPVYAPSGSKAPQVSFPGPIVRSDDRSTSRNDNPTDTRGLYRKDYEDIGRIWKERQERRDTDSDRRRSDHDSRDTNWRSGHHFGGRYSFYAYDYLPGRVYPSPYCYYYGHFPPYISGLRVIYISHPYVRFTYIDLPGIIILPGYSGRDDYYYRDWKYRSLSDALREIETAWERGDIDGIMDHVRRYSRIEIYMRDEYAYSVDWQDYYDMTLDAMNAVRTRSFDFYKVRERSDHRAVAYAEHVYYDDWGYYESGLRKTVYLSYTLERYGDDWYITEVGLSPDRSYY